MKSLRKAYRGEKGFTLVELLVVVVILGVLAAVATLAVTRFIGSGNLEAANTELANAKTAIQTAMYEGKGSQIDGDTFPIEWAGEDGTILVNALGDAGDSIDGTFKATYLVAVDGTITGVKDGSVTWSGVKWDTVNGGWIEE